MGKLSVLICSIFLLSLNSLQAQHTLSGYVYDAGSGEALIGATVYAKDLKKGISSNIYGFYSLTLPEGKTNISISFIGYEAQTIEVNLVKDVDLTIKLQPASQELREVVISAESNAGRQEVHSTQMGQIKVPMDQIKHLPSLGGEVDVIKAMQLMPGVKRGGEGQTGMYVRGGGADQNLILLDEATVYNVSHLFGFFSVFNNEALKDVTLIKGGFPANYGGRISSILDIRMKEGNQQRYSAEGGIGLLSSRLTLEGPLVKDRSSFLISARRSYLDKVIGWTTKMSVPYYFYDLNAKFNYKISDKDRLYYSAYYGNDVLSEPKMEGDKSKGESDSSLLDFGFVLGNFTNTLRWNHLYNPKLFSNLSLVYTRFRYDINGEFWNNKIFIGSRIRDMGAKMDFDYYLNARNHIRYGASFTNHIFRPNIVTSEGWISEAVKTSSGQKLSTQELGVYINNDFTVTEKLGINYGLRVSGLATQQKLYKGLEPRFSATYAFTKDQSVKLGYSRMYQYMHLVSSSSVSLPTDLWYPVTGRIKPESADQVALGYTLNLEKIKSIVSVEGYYKWMHNLIEYKEGAVLVLNDNYENELLTGKGDAYGVEVFINKTKGRFTGWAGYTLSWATRQFDGLNGGKSFYAKYDRRHDISLVGSFDISKRITFSAVWVYATGQRLTGRTGQYISPNPAYSSIDVLPLYTGRNELRFSPSHRLDVNLVIKRKPGKTWEGEWNIGAYNVYNRAQPYKVNVVVDKNTNSLKYQQVGLLGFVPSIGYNFKF